MPTFVTIKKRRNPRSIVKGEPSLAASLTCWIKQIICSCSTYPFTEKHPNSSQEKEMYPPARLWMCVNSKDISSPIWWIGIELDPFLWRQGYISSTYKVILWAKEPHRPITICQVIFTPEPDYPTSPGHFLSRSPWPFRHYPKAWYWNSPLSP